MMRWMSTVIDWLRDKLVQSSFVHLHQEPAHSVGDLVGLIDRFLFDGVRYPLEWDDFISYQNENAHLEKIRLEIMQFELLLFSSRGDDRQKYREELLRVRNRIAPLIGISARTDG